MFLAMYPVRLRAAGVMVLSATLLGGCFALEDGRRPYFDHAHYAPVGGVAEDIFINPVGHVDRTIPNRLGRLDVAPINNSFETDEAARKRAKLTLPPQPVVPPVVVVPKAGSQTGREAAPGGDAPSRPLRQRGPARPVAPNVVPAEPAPTQSQTQLQDPILNPSSADPVSGVILPQAIPVDKPWATTVKPRS